LALTHPPGDAEFAVTLHFTALEKDQRPWVDALGIALLDTSSSSSSGSGTGAGSAAEVPAHGMTPRPDAEEGSKQASAAAAAAAVAADQGGGSTAASAPPAPVAPQGDGQPGVGSSRSEQGPGHTATPAAGVHQVGPGEQLLGPSVFQHEGQLAHHQCPAQRAPVARLHCSVQHIAHLRFIARFVPFLGARVRMVQKTSFNAPEMRNALDAAMQAYDRGLLSWISMCELFLRLACREGRH